MLIVILLEIIILINCNNVRDFNINFIINEVLVVESFDKYINWLCIFKFYLFCRVLN